MKKYEKECFSQEQIKQLCWNPVDKNDYITETAGFVPLEVKLKRFEESGAQLQFMRSEFTSSDYRDMYLTPDFEITPEMDYEEIQEVLLRRSEFVKELKMNKKQTLETKSPKSPPAGSQTEELQKSEPKEEVNQEA